MSNERLRTAIARARKTPADVARVTGVDPKTVYRWLGSTERLPHARHRFAVAKLVGEDEEWLWPSAATQGPEPQQARTGEIVSSYPYRSAVPNELWRELVSRATRQIDLLGYTLYFLTLQHPELIPLLIEKCNNGCLVRVVIADPASEHVAYRDREEGTPLTLVVRIQTTLDAWKDLIGRPGFELRYQDIPLYNSVFRFDGEMFVTPHLYGTPGSHAPLLHLRHLGAGGLFSRFADHFQAVWNASAPQLRGQA